MSVRKLSRHWKAALAVSLLAFASGAVVGVAATLHYESNNLPRFMTNPDGMPERIVAHLRGELGLSDDQAKQVLQIFERGHGRLRAMRAEVEPRINVIVQDTFNEVSRVLNPDLQEAWRNWFEKMKRRFTPHGDAETAPAP